MDLHAQLRQLVADAQSALDAADSDDAVHKAKAGFIGRAGSVNAMLKQMRDLSTEERPAFGQAVNAAKAEIEALVEARKADLQTERRAAELAGDRVDLSLPGRRVPRGAVHPLRQAERAIVSVFRDMGYSVALGPQIEHDFHNFEALNFPADHPARDMQDTFAFDDGRLLRTHTSPVQIRTLLADAPPIRIVAPGAVYRCDTLDMTHSPNFHQVEGLVVDRGVTMAHLKGTLQEFAARLFQKEDLGVRLRPSFFPFTEPSVEVDIECPFCTSGCRVCGQTRWIEILGAGLVDPEVFRATGVDPDEFTGFAFGIGVERVAMLFYGIDDIRLFYENDLRFLAQFS